MSQDQNAGQSHSMKIFEMMKEFKYLGTNKNSIQEEIRAD